MTRRTGLGRGLEALIPGGEPPAAAGVSLLPVDAILRNPRQPRQHFDDAELNELAASIAEHGVLQPLIVTTGAGPGEYILVAGERRLLAARRAGLQHVPALLREASDQQRLELALIENVQRADLAALETAEAYRQLSEDFGLSHEQISSRVGKSRVAVTNTLRLLKLPPDVQQALAGGQISEGHARALLALSSAPAQSAALKTILAKELNVRQAEDLVRLLSGVKPAPSKDAKPGVSPPLPDILDLQNRLEASLGTRVNLKRNRKGKGTLMIHFYSDEELDAIIGKLVDG